ncbi:MAG: 6-phosphogluconolactonase [Gemmatimonadaceae bacterium]
MDRQIPEPRRIIQPDPESFPDAAAALIVDVIEDSVRHHGHCAAALAGGSTPRPVYECLARPPLAARVDWGRIAIYFGDERCVPPGDEQSNYRMVNEALLRQVPIPCSSIHRMEGERADRDAAARDYERLLPAQLDLLVLGMGEDGHTASLFPHSPALAERERRVVPVTGPGPVIERLTITPPVIDAAETVIVLVAGAGKATIIARALEGPYVPDDLPVQLALGGTWLIDDAAARELRRDCT